MNVNKWEKIKTFINKLPIGTIVSRKEIIFLIYNRTYINKSSYGSTIDNWRRCLELLGILEPAGRGLYKVKYHIRKDLTSTELRDCAYGGYRRWFNNIKVIE
jgi:hypothetical protein